MEFLSIDSFGEEYAVCEDDNGKSVYVRMDKIPKDAKEGDIIEFYNQDKIVLNAEKTKKRRNQVLKLQRDLFGK